MKLLFFTGTLLALAYARGERESMSRQDCVELGGTVVGDIGNGAIYEDDYVCDGTGEPPIGNILPADDEPIATEGEICCGSDLVVGRPVETSCEVDADCPQIACLVEPCDINICNDDGICELVPDKEGKVECGPNTCIGGQVCCNESCGICTEPGDVR